MRVEFRKTFEKDLRKLNDKSLLAKLKAAIEAVEQADSLETIANLKKLKGDDGYFCIRIGDYRASRVIFGGGDLDLRPRHASPRVLSLLSVVESWVVGEGWVREIGFMVPGVRQCLGLKP